MFEYYTIVIFIGIICMSIMLTILITDQTLPKSNVIWFAIDFITLIMASFMEWLVVLFQETSNPYVTLNTVLMAFVFFITPCIPVCLAWSVKEAKGKRLTNVIIVLLAINFILPFSSIFNSWVFYYDANNVYHRGDNFTIYAIAMILSVLILFYTIYRVSKKYQNKNNYILFLILILLLSAVAIHFSFSEIYVIWIGSGISFLLIYIYFSMLVNQTDVLTNLLNRRSYEGKLYDLKSDASILFFDVNDFKYINDTYGHSMGDYCLEEIGKAIKLVYDKYGLCYRIGGDEFCVILLKDTNLVEKLNFQFSSMLSNGIYKLVLPTVSVGYSNFYVGMSNIHETIEKAEERMYIAKRDRKFN